MRFELLRFQICAASPSGDLRDTARTYSAVEAGNRPCNIVNFRFSIHKGDISSHESNHHLCHQLTSRLAHIAFGGCQLLGGANCKVRDRHSQCEPHKSRINYFNNSGEAGVNLKTRELSTTFTKNHKRGTCVANGHLGFYPVAG